MQLLDLLSIDWVQRLGWMLLHSLWQMAAVAAMVAVAMKRFRRRSAEVRYVAGCGGMALMMLLPLATAICIQPRAFLTMPTADVNDNATADARPTGEGGSSAHVASAVAGEPDETTAAGDTARPTAHGRSARRQPAAPPSVLDRLAEKILPWLPQVVGAWMAGVVGMALWHVGGWLVLVRMRQAAAEMQNTQVVRRLAELAHRMDIGRRVRLLESARVEVPITFGWLRPVILAPASVLTSLAPDQLDAILAHELAHIRRYDYLMNLCQTAAETMFFYHPAVWWISRQIRIEREHCCDDAAVAACGNPLLYAQALASLETIRAIAGLQLAATGSPDAATTLDRVRRILGLMPHRTAASGMRTWMGGILAGFLLSATLYGSAADRYWERMEFSRIAALSQPYQPDYSGALDKLDIDHKNPLLSLIRQAVYFQDSNSQKNDAAEPAIGASRVGGRPDLPPDIAWPTWKGRHQAFVAQIDLASLPKMPGRDMLPARGRLYFFYAVECDDNDEILYGDDDSQAGAAPVIYCDPSAESLVRHPFPDDLTDGQKLPVQTLTPKVFNTVPDFEHPAWRLSGLLYDEIDAVDRSWNIAEKDRPHPYLQMLGHPCPMQLSIGLEIELGRRQTTDSDDAVYKRAEQWELLFQGLDLFGECSIYYMIRHDDLLNRRWDKAWFCVQAT